VSQQASTVGESNVGIASARPVKELQEIALRLATMANDHVGIASARPLKVLHEGALR